MGCERMFAEIAPISSMCCYMFVVLMEPSSFALTLELVVPVVGLKI